jgi:hypothetical protein
MWGGVKRLLFRPVLGLAVVGVAVCAILNVLGLLGIRFEIGSPLDRALSLVSVGVIPTVLLAAAVAARWDTPFSGTFSFEDCPRRMRVVVYGFAGYGLAMMLISWFADWPPDAVRDTAVGLFFYAGSMAASYSALRAAKRLDAGHPGGGPGANVGQVSDEPTTAS